MILFQVFTIGIRNMKAATIKKKKLTFFSGVACSIGAVLFLGLENDKLNSASSADIPLMSFDMELEDGGVGL